MHTQQSSDLFFQKLSFTLCCKLFILFYLFLDKRFFFFQELAVKNTRE